MIKELKEIAYHAILHIGKMDLSPLSWGNLSVIDRKKSLIAIKSSGVPINKITYNDISIIDIDGNCISGQNPSVDSEIHCTLYKNFLDINTIIHTHSYWATIWSQMGIDIPVLGTTHADYFKTPIPCTRPLLKKEVQTIYEKNIAHSILERFKSISYRETPAVLVNSHGPFIWGEDIDSALNHAIILEVIANFAWHTYLFTQKSIPQFLIDKHYYRKHPGKKIWNIVKKLL